MRSERLYLSDIVQAADEIRAFLIDRAFADFVEDGILRSAVLYQLMIIGEASSHLSPSLRQRHPEIEWPDVIGFRNRAVHAYFAMDWTIVWETAVDDTPELSRVVAAILAAEYPSEESPR